MKKIQFVGYLFVVTLLVMSTLTQAQNNDGISPMFPILSGENLNSKKFTLPQDLPAEKTLVLIAFERDQQVVLDSWTKGLDLLNSQIPWVELPVIATPYILGSFMINSGMRKGIPNPQVRENVITLYTDREAFANAMGFDYDKHEAFVAVVNRSGQNLGVVKGYYDETKRKIIMSLLGIN